MLVPKEPLEDQIEFQWGTRSKTIYNKFRMEQNEDIQSKVLYKCRDERKQIQSVAFVVLDSRREVS